MGALQLAAGQIRWPVRFMSYEDDLPGPLNLGNPDEITVLQLAETIIDLTNSRGRVIHKPLPADDPTQRRPDITEAKRLLEWHPRTPLREGLRNTIEYFDRLLTTRGRRAISQLSP